MEPGLGTLSRILPELRVSIYDYAIDTSDREVNALTKCTPDSTLLLVSKTLHNECAPVLEAARSKPCAHTDYFLSLLPNHPSVPPPVTIEELQDLFDVEGLKLAEGKHSNFGNVKQLRMISINVGKDQPLALVARFKGQAVPTLRIYGASRHRQGEIHYRLGRQLEELFADAHLMLRVEAVVLTMLATRAVVCSRDKC